MKEKCVKGEEKHVRNDLSGQRFGRLTVVCLSDRRAPRGARTVPLWECLCDCGELTYKATDTLKNADLSMCASCSAKYAAERMRKRAGYVDGTQISRLKRNEGSAASPDSARGVYFDKRSGKWRARLRFKGKLMNFGSYSNFEDALEARRRAEREYFEPLLCNVEGQ